MRLRGRFPGRPIHPRQHLPLVDLLAHLHQKLVDIAGQASPYTGDVLGANGAREAEVRPRRRQHRAGRAGRFADCLMAVAQRNGGQRHPGQQHRSGDEDTLTAHIHTCFGTPAGRQRKPDCF